VLEEFDLDGKEGLSEAEVASYLMTIDGLELKDDEKYASWEFTKDAKIDENDLKKGVFNKEKIDGNIDNDSLIALDKISNEELKERYELVTQRVAELAQDASDAGKYADYFEKTAQYLVLLDTIVKGAKGKEIIDKLYVDIIGDAYMFLIENFASDAGKKAGEFFTPKEVSTLLAKLTKSAPGSRICDPTCGSGSLLIKAGREVGSNNFSLYGQELNGSTWALAMMNMLLHGFDSAVIRWGDTLRNPKLKDGDALMKFDTVVANPPFSLDKWGADEAANDQYNRFWRGVPPKSKGDWAFISHMLEVANEHGKVGVVIPHGVLFRGAGEGKIRQQTVEENLLEAVIGLPANLFYGTGIPAAIAIFNKAKKYDEVLFIDASREFENGKNQNRLRDTDIEHIVSTYRKFADGKLLKGVVEDKYAYIATRKEIKDNDYNLNIPRYVDTYEEEAEIDILAVQQEINSLEAELVDVQEKMKECLKELGI
jgi:type I restriction enzyme M protein